MRVKKFKEFYESMNKFFPSVTVVINLHNKLSYDKDTIFSTIKMPLEKAYKIFGDCDILYPQLAIVEVTPVIKFGIVIEDEYDN